MKFWLADERIMVKDPNSESRVMSRLMATTPARSLKVEVEVFDENGHPIGQFVADREDFKRLALVL